MGVKIAIVTSFLVHLLYASFAVDAIMQTVCAAWKHQHFIWDIGRMNGEGWSREGRGKGDEITIHRQNTPDLSGSNDVLF